MTRTGFRLIVFLALLVVVALAPQYAAAQCNEAYANGFTAAVALNNEGHTERPADILISTGAVTNCFEAGNTISVTYGGILTNPANLSNTSTKNIVITNPNAAADGTLTVGVVTTTGISATGPQTLIQISILGPTTDPNASITLQNLRFDVTGLAATNAVPATMNAFVGGSSAGLTSVSHLAVGTVIPTVDLTLSGIAPVGGGTGLQSSGGPLTTDAVVTFGTNAIWPISPFRIANPSPAYPVGCAGAACTDTVDIPTTATSLVIDIESIPSGVTVTLPSTLSVFANVGDTKPTWQWKLRTNANSAGVVQGIYDTVVAPAAAGGVSVFVSTGAAAADATSGSVGPPAVAATPITIGVQIGASSGNGTATIRVVFGPGLSAAFTGDDANATAVPVYTAAITTGSVGREIITDGVINGKAAKVNTAPTAFFTITPVQSVLLFSYVTDLDSYNTGIAVANTGSDGGVFTATTKAQTGPITFYLFQTGTTTPIVYTAKSGNGRGLDANGNLPPGNVFAIALDSLLTAAGQSALVGNFSGYVVALGQFNYGHGFSIVFDPNGNGTAVQALFLGSGFRLDVAQGLGL